MNTAYVCTKIKYIDDFTAQILLGICENSLNSGCHCAPGMDRSLSVCIVISVGGISVFIQKNLDGKPY